MNNNKMYNKLYKSNNNLNWKGITLSKAAAKRILQLIQKNSKILGLSISIKKSGCAGFTYTLNTVMSIDPKNIIFEYKGAKLFVSHDIMPLIDGTQLDYIQEGLNYSFKFNNPQVQYSCGCGESFGF